MMSKLFFVSAFYLSFLPLWLVVLARYFRVILSSDGDRFFAQCAVLVIVGCWTICFRCVLRQFKGKDVEELQIVEVTERKSISAEMLLSYVLPLLVFDFMKRTGVVEFLVFFAALSILAGRYNLLQGSLFLELIGYRFYECRLKSGRVLHVVSSKHLFADKVISLNTVRLNNQTCMVVDEGIRR